MKTATSPYTETLGQAMSAINAQLIEDMVILADGNDDWLNTFSFGGLKYGETKEAHAEISTIKLKNTKKFAHATIYRLESGRYEWLAYYL